MVTILQGDCIEEMRKLPAGSVHLIVTSPPYWGLRDYGVPPSIWPESEEASDDCEHEWEEHLQPAANGIIHAGGMSGETLSGKSATRGPKRSDFCRVCNAWRGVFGLEPTPELYIAHLIYIMREAKRALRKDGTLWLNLGDSYASGAGSVGECPGSGAQGRAVRDKYWGKHGAIGLPQMTQPNRLPIAGVKAGDLVGIPWRAVFALQADGWWHRRDNIWFKPNPMPESVNGWRWEKHRIKQRDVASRSEADWKKRPKGWQAGQGAHDKIPNGNYRQNGAEQTVAEYVDCLGCSKCAPNGGLILRKGNWRCTTSHEYVFQFSKSDSYFCNAEAAREVSTQRPSGNKSRFIARVSGERGRLNNHLGSSFPYQPNPSGRNRRSVWKIATKPYRGAHFATFPPDLIRPIIAAASPVHRCGECGAPYAPVVMRGAPDLAHQQACGGDRTGHYNGKATKAFATAGAEDASAVKARILAGMSIKTVVDHRPTCRCSVLGRVPDPAPATVLDPFGGSGTVGQVAQDLGRDAILIELSEAYIPLIKKRCGLVEAAA